MGPCFFADRLRHHVARYVRSLPILAALIFAGLICTTPSTNANSIIFGYDVPSTAEVEKQTPISFSVTLETSNTAPNIKTGAVFVSNAELAYGDGSINVGNRLFVGGVPNGVYSRSIDLSHLFYIPGFYKTDLHVDYSQVVTCDPPTSCPNGPFAFVSFDMVRGILVSKDPEVRERHLGLAAAANKAGTQLDLANLLLSGLTGTPLNRVLSTINTFVQLGLGATDSKWGTILSIMLASIGGFYLGGPVIALASTVSLLASAYFSAIAGLETKLANDPPNADYQHIYSYSLPTFKFDFGLGAQVDTFLQNGLTLVSKELDAAQGELTSTERGEGALAANDLSWVEMQGNTAHQFSLDSAQAKVDVANWFASLPQFLTSQGADAVVGNFAGFDSVYSGYSSDLLAIVDVKPTPGSSSVAEPSTIWLLLSAGLLVVITQRRLQRGEQIK